MPGFESNEYQIKHISNKMSSIKTTIFPTLGDVNPLNLLICEQVAKPSPLCDPKSNPRKIRQLKCRDSFFIKKEAIH